MLMTTGTGGYPDCALGLIPIVPDDIQAVHEQVAGMAGTRVTRTPRASGR